MVDTTESVGDGAFMLLSSGSESIYQSLEVPKRHHSVILDTCALNDFDNLRQTQRLPCHVIELRSVPESRVEASILSESLGYQQSQLPPYRKENQVPQRKPIPLLMDRVKVKKVTFLGKEQCHTWWYLHTWGFAKISAMLIQNAKCTKGHRRQASLISQSWGNNTAFQ